MPSRINIGPEDGPYVAINESSGNLQLEDNSGNVVAEWDDGQSQWDFVENDISGVGAFDSESVNTEDLGSDRLLDSIHFVDPNTDDLGESINQILESDEFTSNDIISIPPGSYDHSTPISPDIEPLDAPASRAVHIMSSFGEGGTDWRYPVRVTAKADVPFIDPAENNSWSCQGIYYDGDGRDIPFGFRARNESHASRCAVSNIQGDPGHAFEFRMISGQDSTIGSSTEFIQFNDVSGDGIHVDSDIDRDSRAMHFHARGGGSDGWLANIEDPGGRGIWIEMYIGSNTGEGGIRTRGSDGWARINTPSTTEPTFQFDSPASGNWFEAGYPGIVGLAGDRINENTALHMSASDGPEFQGNDVKFEGIKGVSEPLYADRVVFSDRVTNDPIDVSVDLQSDRGYAYDLHFDSVLTDEGDESVKIRFNNDGSSDYSYVSLSEDDTTLSSHESQSEIEVVNFGGLSENDLFSGRFSLNNTNTRPTIDGGGATRFRGSDVLQNAFSFVGSPTNSIQIYQPDGQEIGEANIRVIEKRQF